MKTRNKVLIAGAIVAALGGLALAGTSYARQGGHMGGGHHGMGMMGGMMRGMAIRHFFKTVDADEDGKVAQAEIDKALADRMARYDTNKDGKLSLTEFEGVWLELSRPLMVRGFQRLDPDGDAAITEEELASRFGRIVERFDRNGDGVLTRQDRRHHRRGGMHGAPRERDGDK